MKKICFVITVEFALKAFLVEHLKALSQHFEITVVVNTLNPSLLKELGINANLIPIKIARDISPWQDLKALFDLTKAIYINKFDAVHTVTPKAGLLGILAATITLTKFRIHTFQGEVWLTKKGFIRALLKGLDRLVAKLATHITVVSASERDFLISENIISPQKSIVFYNGSIAGVNLNRFKPDFLARVKLRADLKINSEDIIYLYIGRLNKDKGVLDLAKAFSQLSIPRSYLMFVGPDEHNLTSELQQILKDKKSSFSITPETNLPENFLKVADVVCLPSYREGFGVVLIEAAACGVPAIASRIYGVTDAVVDNETGLLHAPKDINAIKTCMEQMANKAKRLRLAKNARVRAIKDFDSKLITQAWVDFYRQHVNLND